MSPDDSASSPDPLDVISDESDSPPTHSARKQPRFTVLSPSPRTPETPESTSEEEGGSTRNSRSASNDTPSAEDERAIDPEGESAEEPETSSERGSTGYQDGDDEWAFLKEAEEEYPCPSTLDGISDLDPLVFSPDSPRHPFQLTPNRPSSTSPRERNLLIATMSTDGAKSDTEERDQGEPANVTSSTIPTEMGRPQDEADAALGITEDAPSSVVELDVSMDDADGARQEADEQASANVTRLDKPASQDLAAFETPVSVDDDNVDSSRPSSPAITESVELLNHADSPPSPHKANGSADAKDASVGDDRPIAIRDEAIDRKDPDVDMSVAGPEESGSADLDPFPESAGQNVEALSSRPSSEGPRIDDQAISLSGTQAGPAIIGSSNEELSDPQDQNLDGSAVITSKAESAPVEPDSELASTPAPTTPVAQQDEGEEELDEDMHPTSEHEGADADEDVDMEDASAAAVTPSETPAKDSKTKSSSKKTRPTNKPKAKPTSKVAVMAAAKKAGKGGKSKTKADDLKSGKSKVSRDTPVSTAMFSAAICAIVLTDFSGFSEWDVRVDRLGRTSSSGQPRIDQRPCMVHLPQARV